MSEKRSTGPIQTGQNGVRGQDSNLAPAHIPTDARTKVQMYALLGALNTLLKCDPDYVLRPTVKFAHDTASKIYGRMESGVDPVPDDALFTMMEAHALLDRLLGAGLLAYSSKAEALRIRGELKKFFPQTISNDDGGSAA